MKNLFTAAALAVMTATAAAQQQQPPAGGAPQQPVTPSPLEVVLKRQHTNVRGWLAKAAEVMPEEHYTFEMTPAQRTYAEFVGHIAQANFGQCSQMLGQPNPLAGQQGQPGRNLQNEAPKLSKAELVKLLNDALAICDKAYDGMTAQSALELIGPRQTARAGIAVANIAHNNETYGTMVAYLRLKGITPPSSEGR